MRRFGWYRRKVAQQMTRSVRTGLSLTVNLIADTRSCRVVFSSVKLNRGGGILELSISSYAVWPNA
jgi:hypothetical protein